MTQPELPNGKMTTFENEDTPLTQEKLAFKKSETKDNLSNAKEDGKRPRDKIGVSVEHLQKVYNQMKESKKTRKEVHHHYPNAHQNYITSVALTSNNRYIISGSRDKSIKVFDLDTKQEVHDFANAHKHWITSLAVTSNNGFIVSGSVDKSIKVFDLHAKQEVHHFQDAHSEPINSVAVTSDNRFIISGSWDKSIKVFDLQTKQEVHHFQDAHHNSINSVTVTSDNRFIISGSQDKSIKVFDLHTKQEVHHFSNVHRDHITSLAVTSDDRFIISGSVDNSIKVFDLKVKKEIHHFRNAHQQQIYSVIVTSDNRFIISASSDKSIKVFDLHTKQQVHHFQAAHDHWITSLAVTSDNRFIISGSQDKSIKVFDLHTKQEAHHFPKAHKEHIYSMAVTSDNRFIISGSLDKSIKIYDLQTKQEIHQFQDAHQSWVSSVAVTSDNRFMISCSSDLSIKVFDLQTKQQVHHFQDAHGHHITSLAVTSDNKFIISGSVDNSIKVFDLHTKQEVHHFPNAHQESINSVAVTSDNRFIISGSWDKSIKIFDLQTKQEVHHFPNAHLHSINSVTVTSDNRFIVSGSSDNSIKVFDLHTKQQVHHFRNAHQHYITSVAVTSDNRFIISGSRDKSIKVFDLHTKEEVHHFPNAHQDHIPAITVTSDNRFIISGSFDKSIKMFDLQNKTIQEESNFIEPTKSNQPSELIPIEDYSFFKQELFYMNEGIKKFTVFSSADDFLFDRSATDSVSFARRQPELFILPFHWTTLHTVSIFAHHDFILEMPEYSQFKMPFLVDSFNQTPLHYLVAQKNVNFISANIILRYICDFMEDCQFQNPIEFQHIVGSLSSLLPYIFTKIEVKLRQRFFLLAYTKTPAPSCFPVPLFGDILSEAALFSDSPVLTLETREKIWNAQGTAQIEFCSNFLYLDYDILSQDMKNVTDCLKKQKGQDIFTTPAIAGLIDYLWQQAEKPLLIFFALYSAFIIALSVYLTFDDGSLAYEITLLVASVLFTANEFWQMSHLKKNYLEDIWNWLDLTQLLLTIAFLGTRLVDNENGLARAWMSTVIIVLGYVRWISLLKIFKPTRNLIQVVIKITKDMLSFITIIALIIIAFSIIFLVFNREAGYGDYLYQAYNVMYGPMDIEEDTAWPFSQKLIMAVLAFFLNVVLLNLLISIMGESYGQVLEMRDKTDSLTRLEMISEAVIYKKFFKMNHQTKRGYLVYCLPVEVEEDEDDKNNELITTIKKIIQRNNEESNQELQGIKDEIVGLKASSQANSQAIQVSNQAIQASNQAMKDKLLNLEALLTSLQNGFSQLQTSLNPQRREPGAIFRKDLPEDSPHPEDHK